MPTPTAPISIKVKNTNLSEGEYVKITNFTSGGTLRGRVNSSGEITLDPNASSLTWADGDKVQAESTGRIPFVSYGTISKSSFKAVSTASTADTSTPAVDM
jgi:hypothetical protein